MAYAGAIPMYPGSRAWVAEATTRASGSAPSSSAAAALASTTALAPSFSGEEFPAVIWVVFGCGGGGASPSAPGAAGGAGEPLRARVVADALVVLERPRRLLAGGLDLDRLDLLGEAPRVASG